MPAIQISNREAAAVDPAIVRRMRPADASGLLVLPLDQSTYGRACLLNATIETHNVKAVRDLLESYGQKEAQRILRGEMMDEQCLHPVVAALKSGAPTEIRRMVIPRLPSIRR